jgi:transcriptional antiterminator NusG
VQVASSCEKKVKATLEQRAVTLGVDNRILEIEIPQTPGVKDSKEDGSSPVDRGRSLPRSCAPVRMVLDEDDTMMAVRGAPTDVEYQLCGCRGASRHRPRSRGRVKPRPLSRQEVDRIFKRAAEKKPVVEVDLAEGDQILVTAGPFKDFQGEVIEVSGERSKLKALLSIFGRETPVDLDFSPDQQAELISWGRPGRRLSDPHQTCPLFCRALSRHPVRPPERSPRKSLP